MVRYPDYSDSEIVVEHSFFRAVDHVHGNDKLKEIANGVDNFYKNTVLW